MTLRINSPTRSIRRRLNDRRRHAGYLDDRGHHVATASPARGPGLSSVGTARPEAKRVIDVFVAGVGLVVLFPVMVTIALLITLTSPGPFLFRQVRLGRGGRPFRFLKFRTMAVDAEERLGEVEALNESAGGVLFKIRNDPRVTPLGRLLRRWSLDELPQLVNVLRGEMSLVGPRPLQSRDCELLKARDPDAFARRLSAASGPHRRMAGRRAERDRPHRHGAARPRLHRELVTRPRPGDLVPDGRGRPARPRGLLTLERYPGTRVKGPMHLDPNRVPLRSTAGRPRRLAVGAWMALACTFLVASGAGRGWQDRRLGAPGDVGETGLVDLADLPEKVGDWQLVEGGETRLRPRSRGSRAPPTISSGRMSTTSPG